VALAALAAEGTAMEYSLASILAQFTGTHMSTFNGFGTKYYGKARRIGDTFVVTEWITALYLPIIPLCSHRVRKISQKAFTVIVYSSVNTQYEVVENIPLNLNLGQVFRTWSFTLALVAYTAAASTSPGVRNVAWSILALVALFLLVSARRSGGRKPQKWAVLAALALAGAWAWQYLNLTQELLAPALVWIGEAARSASPGR
jgi:hypothetical protein